MAIEQIQDLIANAVKVQLEEDVCKTHLYRKRVNALWLHCSYQSLKFQQFNGKGNPNGMLHISLSHVTMLAQTATW